MARDDPVLIPRVPVMGGLCVQIVADLLAMEAASPGEEIKIYLNSPESIPYHIVAIIDVIKQEFSYSKSFRHLPP
eukprot:11975-Prorocentrum_minimum.AAC.6